MNKMRLLKHLNGLLLIVGVTTSFSSCVKYGKVKETLSIFLNTRTFEKQIRLNAPIAWDVSGIDNTKKQKEENIIEKLPCFLYQNFSIQDIINHGDTLFKVSITLQPSYKNVDLLVKLDSIDSYKVIDSWGLINFEEEFDEDLWHFAEKIGCPLSNNLSDIEIHSRLEIASSIRFQFYLELDKDLRRKIKVTNQNWDRGYGNYASGSAIIHNESSYTLPKLEYEIDYSDSNGKITAKDKGIASYNSFHPGAYESFSFYTANVANAEYAHVKPVIDRVWVWQFVERDSYKGTEFEEFMRNNTDRTIKNCKWND